MDHICQAMLNRLRLTGLLQTLPMRLNQAEQDSLTHVEFLQLLLQDEIERREGTALANRLKSAHFEASQVFENLDLKLYPPLTQQSIRNLQNNQYLKTQQHVIIMGPTGTGKTHLAQALGHLACRKGFSTRFIRANALFRALQASRADNSCGKTFRNYLVPKLLIIDDFGLQALSLEEANDIYELIAERAAKGSLIITSNRTVDAWVKLFPDPVMANAALDRLANNAHQIILTGESYRKKNRPNVNEMENS